MAHNWSKLLFTQHDLDMRYDDSPFYRLQALGSKKNLMLTELSTIFIESVKEAITEHIVLFKQFLHPFRSYLASIDSNYSISFSFAKSGVVDGGTFCFVSAWKR